MSDIKDFLQEAKIQRRPPQRGRIGIYLDGKRVITLSNKSQITVQDLYNTLAETEGWTSVATTNG